jgi:hypothetical protein
MRSYLQVITMKMIKNQKNLIMKRMPVPWLLSWFYYCFIIWIVTSCCAYAFFIIRDIPKDDDEYVDNPENKVLKSNNSTINLLVIICFKFMILILVKYFVLKISKEISSELEYRRLSIFKFYDLLNGKLTKTDDQHKQQADNKWYSDYLALMEYRKNPCK